MATSLTRKGLVAVSDKVILAAQPAMELVKLFATDFSPEPAAKGDTVNMKVLKATAADFAKSTQNYVTSTNTISYADVKLNKDKISVYTLDDMDDIDDELAAIWDRLGPTAGRAIGNAFIKDVCALLTYGKAESQKTIATAAFADFVKIRSAVENGGYDPADCVVLLVPEVYDALIALMPASVVGEGGVVNAGLIGSRLGFKAILNAPHIAKDSAASASKGVGFAIPTNAIAIANRDKKVLKAGGNLVESGYSVDEETGLVIGTRVVVNPADGECSWAAEALYGMDLAKQTVGSTSNGAPGYLQLVTA